MYTKKADCTVKLWHLHVPSMTFPLAEKACKCSQGNEMDFVEFYLWKLWYEVMGIGFLGCWFYVTLRYSITPIADVLSDSSGKQYRLLTNHSYVLTKPLEIQIPDVYTIKQHLKTHTGGNKWMCVWLCASVHKYTYKHPPPPDTHTHIYIYIYILYTVLILRQFNKCVLCAPMESAFIKLRTSIWILDPYSLIIQHIGTIACHSTQFVAGDEIKTALA